MAIYKNILILLLLVYLLIVLVKVSVRIINWVYTKNNKYANLTEWVYRNYNDIISYISDSYCIDVSNLHIELYTYHIPNSRYADYVSNGTNHMIRIYLYNIEDQFRLRFLYKYNILKCIIHELIHHAQYMMDKDIFNDYIIPEENINKYQEQPIEKLTEELTKEVIYDNMYFILSKIIK